MRLVERLENGNLVTCCHRREHGTVPSERMSHDGDRVKRAKRTVPSVEGTTLQEVIDIVYPAVSV